MIMELNIEPVDNRFLFHILGNRMIRPSVGNERYPPERLCYRVLHSNPIPTDAVSSKYMDFPHGNPVPECIVVMIQFLDYSISPLIEHTVPGTGPHSRSLKVPAQILGERMISIYDS